MRFGLHIPIAGGLQHAASLAEKAGCQTLQIFSGNPRGWKSTPPRKDDIEAFTEALISSDIYPLVLHTPYLVNLASPDDPLWHLSTEVVGKALDLAQAYKARYLVTHVGNHKGSGQEAGLSRVAGALSTILSDNPGEGLILLENGPGAGTEVASLFEQMASILEAVQVEPDRVGICLDTAHLWAAGYDLSTKIGVESTVDHFNQVVGLERLHVLHANDNLQRFGGHRDIHQNLGEGLIGRLGFQALFTNPRLQDLAVIMETPGDVIPEGQRNLEVARSLAR